MSRANVEASLEAAERALDHFAMTLERAGFAAGADAYGQLGDVLVGQWLWAEENGAQDLQPRFERVSGLANAVAEQLRPYVTVMDRIRSLQSPAPRLRALKEPPSTADAILQALADAKRPLSATQLRKATGEASAALRRALEQLARHNAIDKIAGARSTYVLHRSQEDNDGST